MKSFIMWCVLCRVVVAWQAPRQVAVSPGGALSGPAGWTRTLWTLQIRPSRSSSARSANSYSILLIMPPQQFLSLLEYCLADVFSLFIWRSSCTCFLFSSIASSHISLFIYHFHCFSVIPNFSNHFLSLYIYPAFHLCSFLQHVQQHVKTHICFQISNCAIYIHLLFLSHYVTPVRKGCFNFLSHATAFFLPCRFKKFLSSLLFHLSCSVWRLYCI